LRFRHIHMLPGIGNSRFPYCTSLYVDDGPGLLIDTGADPSALASIASKVGMVFLTHYHYDHIRNVFSFQGADVHTNPIEAPYFADLDRLAEALGMKHVYGEQGISRWKQLLAEGAPDAPYSTAFCRIWLQLRRLRVSAYPLDEVIHVGSTKVIMLHAPGHTNGHSVAYFPSEGLVYTGDIDLSGFGPWYHGEDGDPDLFAVSAERLCSLDADVYITAHHKGAVSKRRFVKAVRKYLSVIKRRDEKVAASLGAGLTLKQAALAGVSYPPHMCRDPWIFMWEYLLSAKHAARIGIIPEVDKDWPFVFQCPLSTDGGHPSF